MVKVSVIIPVYNNEGTILDTIKSVQQQDFSNLEIIIVDNGSIDSTIEIVEEIARRDPRIVIKTSQRGRSNARNVGLECSNGEYIQFLDADDKLQPKKVSMNVIFLESNPKYFCQISNVEYHKINSKCVVKSNVQYDKFNDLLLKNYIPINCPLFRNQNIIPFKSNIEYNEDWLFWVENLKDKLVNFSIGHNQNNMAIVMITGSNTMNDYKMMTIYKAYVRFLIKKEFPQRSHKQFIADLKLILIFVTLDAKDVPFNTEIKSQFFLEFMISDILLKIPKFQKHVKNKVKYFRSKSLYSIDNEENN